MKLLLSANSEAVKSELIYLFKIMGLNKKYEFDIRVYNKDIFPSIGLAETNTIQISETFIKSHLNAAQLGENGFFKLENGKPDYIGTAFFMLTSLQEHNDKNPDGLGRFKFANSYQNRYSNTKKNIVQYCFDQLAQQLGISTPPEKTKFFLSHDIDTVYGAILEDGFNVMKKGRIDQFLRFFINVAIGKPDWLNIDKIMKLESEYDCKSTFFWIMNKGTLNKREKNADYRFTSKSIQSHFHAVEKAGFENGIHKSISPQSFAEELMTYGKKSLANRYHYLKFNLPEGYDAIAESGLAIDASLGFAEEPGFRNSYGLPFNPYNFRTKEAYSFIEVPLHVMDRTYYQYKKMNVLEAWQDILTFFEKNRENCVLSVLWHNNFFTDYKFKGYLDLYKKILGYIRDNNFHTLSQQEIIDQYSITK